MKKPLIRFFIILLIVAAAGVIYLSTHKGEPPSSDTVIAEGSYELCSEKGFAWFKDWDHLDLAVVRKFYQRHTFAEMQILWDVQVLEKFGNAAGKEHANTFYSWDVYIARLLELGHPFLDFSDYESSLETLICTLFPARTYRATLDRSARETYLNSHGFPSGTTWESYEEFLLKQAVVRRINWWRSGGMDPFSIH